MSPDQRQAILTALKSGNKIEAIKLCREATGMGLAEAKEWVEKLDSSPEALLPAAGELEGAVAPVVELLFAGKKIPAIKLYREQVKPGTGLAEAKEAVERLEAGLRAQHPEKFTASAQKSGCAAALFGAVAIFTTLVVVIAAALVVLIWFGTLK